MYNDTSKGYAAADAFVDDVINNRNAFNNSML